MSDKENPIEPLPMPPPPPKFWMWTFVALWFALLAGLIWMSSSEWFVAKPASRPSYSAPVQTQRSSGIQHD